MMSRTKLSLLVAIVTTLSISLPASAQLSSSEVNLISVGASIVNSLFNPPHRDAEIKADAEIKKAKIAAETEIEKEKLRIAADKVTPLLGKWGVARVSCTPGLVFINGIDADTVCIQPNPTITAGYYTYNREKSQLLRNTSTISQTTQTVGTTTRVTATERHSDKSF